STNNSPGTFRGQMLDISGTKELYSNYIEQRKPRKFRKQQTTEDREMDRTSRRNQRNQKGNMLVFGTLAMTFLSLGLVMSASYGGVFFAQSRLQSSADEIALAGARKLNEFNRLGQMNDMVARCRQLVFATDKQKTEVEESHKNPQLEKLIRQLDDEALEGAE